MLNKDVSIEIKKMVKEEIEKSAMLLISQQQWLYHRLESVAGKWMRGNHLWTFLCGGKDSPKFAEPHVIPPTTLTSVHGDSESHPTTQNNVRGSRVGVWPTAECVTASEPTVAGMSTYTLNGVNPQNGKVGPNPTNHLDTHTIITGHNASGNGPAWPTTENRNNPLSYHAGWPYAEASLGWPTTGYVADSVHRRNNIHNANNVPVWPTTSNFCDPPSCAPKSPHVKQSWQLRKIANATKFDPVNLDGGIREIRYWRKLYRHIDDDQMLATMGLNNSEEIKTHMVDFIEETKTRMGNRSVEHFLAEVTAEYGAVTDVVRMERLQQFMNFRRNADWDVRKFWRKCREGGDYI